MASDIEHLLRDNYDRSNEMLGGVLGPIQIKGPIHRDDQTLWAWYAVDAEGREYGIAVRVDGGDLAKAAA